MSDQETQENPYMMCSDQCFGWLTEQCDPLAKHSVFSYLPATWQLFRPATRVTPDTSSGCYDLHEVFQNVSSFMELKSHVLMGMIAVAVSPDTLAALYLWNPLVIAAAVGGSIGGLENAAVFAALSTASYGDARMAAAAMAGASYLGLHPVLLAVRLPLLVLQTGFCCCYCSCWSHLCCKTGLAIR